MSYSYNFEFPGDDMVANMGISIAYMVITIGAALLTYVFRALSRYAIAKRRGINHPWMAWVPVLDGWLLGCISDQYRCLVKGKNTKRRTIMLVLGILSHILSISILVCSINIMVGSMDGYVSGMSENTLIGSSILLFVLMLPLFGISITYAVFYLMSLYDLYASCEPKNAVLYTVLSIFASVTEPVFQFICRNKDEGMPPRRAVSQIDASVNDQQL